jgi:acetolactate synthase-1/2/3 large subunit
VNGAEAVVRTLVDSGVEVCFSNPGTSELQLVAALDTVPQLRAVLALFEGVATGAADGYGRMSGRPAAVLLHLGPGLANGLANLHNARRAGTPVLVVVGDHATHHKDYDAPLESDIDALAGWAHSWLRHGSSPAAAGADAAAAAAAAAGPPSRVATLVLPADVAWSDGASPAPPVAVPARPAVRAQAVAAARDALRTGRPTVLLLGGPATREAGLVAAARIGAATGARVLGETFPARLERGAGLPPLERVPYLAEVATDLLAGTEQVILAGARAPVSFFAYPGRRGDLLPAGCAVHPLAGPDTDVVGALTALADALDAPADPPRQPAARPELPTGELTGASFADVVGALLPDRAIVVDEANTAGRALPAATAGAPRHDWLTLTGGAIGQGLPVAVGAAVACPDRPVICLEADGSAMYTISALWTMVREQLNVTTVLLNNGAYAILQLEMWRVGVGQPGPKAADQLQLGRPDLDFVALATGMGVPASRATTAAELAQAFGRALAEPGPHLIEAIVPPLG